MKDYGNIKVPHVVVVEGSEGAGKTTQINLLAKKLREQGFTVGVFKSPGGSPDGELIRDFLVNHHGTDMTPTAVALMMMASIGSTMVHIVNEHHRHTFDYILLDRWFYTTLAYQGQDNPGLRKTIASGILGFKDLSSLDPHLMSELIVNHTLVYLDVDPTTANTRLDGRLEHNKFDDFGDAFYNKARVLYKTEIARQKHAIEIDTTGHSVSDIFEELCRRLKAVSIVPN